MAVAEPERLALHAAARGALGPEEGDALMASLPPANTDIATRQELERVETGLRRDIERVETGLRRDIERLERAQSELRAEVRTAIDEQTQAMTAALAAQTAATATAITTAVDAARVRQQRDMWRSLLVTAGVILGGVVGIVQLLG